MAKSVCIVGGGIIGLATGLQIKKLYPAVKLKIIEKEHDLAQHQTGHNSGVIHSGIYYKPGSLKAVNCKKGYQQLIEFCDQEGINYELCGKLIVATSQAELPYLNKLLERGIENGLENLRPLTKDELKDFEPHVNGIAGIQVPQTGIVDYKEVSQKYADKIIDTGGEINLGEKVLGIERKKNIIVKTDKNNYEFDFLINCAGLYSDEVALQTHKNLNLRIIPFRGEYFKLRKEKEYLVKNLIYPVPDPNFPFLGVHFTRMINGGIEAGPNAVLAFRKEGYTKHQIKPSELWRTLTWPGFQKVAAKYMRTGIGEMYRSFSKSAFTRALQKLLPDIKEDDLVEGGAGVRAQACDRSGALLDDFSIIEEENLIHVCNAPSPGATGSLSIGETVAKLTEKYIS